MPDDKRSITADLALYLSDTTLAAGLQYGLWVERAPSVEEQVALSSMSQDKLGHARALQRLAEEATGQDAVELQYDRDPGAFAWNPAWVVPLQTWDELVLAQTLFARALMIELRAAAPDTQLAGLLDKIEQEETWHTKHGDAWLLRDADEGPSPSLAEAFETLWPFAVGFFGVEGEERFPTDIDSGARMRSDDELREAFLDEIVPLLEEAGLKAPATRSDQGWSTEPAPTAELRGDLEARVEDNVVELAGLLQDPAGRELAEL